METIDKKMHDYIYNDKLNIEKAMIDYRNYIYAIIKKISINLPEEDIKEIYVEVFFILWKNQGRLDINKSMSAYLRGITKNLIKHKWREIYNNSYDNILEYEEKLISNFDIETFLCKDEEEEVILSVLEKMRPKYKKIFILYYYENKSINDISETYHLSKSNIKTILFRIRRKIKNTLIKGGYDI